MRLIDADTIFPNGCVTVWEWDGEMTADGILKAIKEAPTIDAEPVQHGKWDVTVCTICGHDLDGWADGAHEQIADGNVHYCPNCGAKMDGGKQDV